MDLNAAQTLKANVGALAVGQQSFAKSLLTQLSQKGSLSEKQWHWVKKLAEQAVTPIAPMPTAEVGDFSGVVALMKKAGNAKSFPKITLQTGDGKQVAISLCGPDSKKPGWLNVTDGKPFGQNVWYGRVSPDGVWEQSSKGQSETAVQALLIHLGQDPAGVASAYGKLTKHCCFCQTKLTDGRSTDVGYGPTCAKNFGLPWGS